MLLLFGHRDKYSIVIPGPDELMNSRVHGSEKALGELVCKRMDKSARPRLPVGGMGMGFTEAAALNLLVAEVVDWHHQLIGAPAGHPLSDPGSSVYIGDVAELLRAEPEKRRLLDLAGLGACLTP